MKKSILLFCTALITLSLVALGFNSLEGSIPEPPNAKADQQVFEDITFPDFFLNVGTRFPGITKENLHKATTVVAFLPKKEVFSTLFDTSVAIIILDDNLETDRLEIGNTNILTAAQLKLLHSADYSANIVIKADLRKRDYITTKVENSHYTPYLTVIPERQAYYSKGNDVLIKFLRKNSKDITAYVQKNKLQSGRLYFTITSDGKVSDVKLESSSGNPSIDEKMIELFTNLPGNWEPAENSKGQKVTQKLVLTFGSNFSSDGC